MTASVLLVRFRSEPETAALFLDVDGTLAPIVERLVARYALVACVSGRVSADVRRMVDVEGVEYVGVHGLEGDPNAERFTPQLEAFAERSDWPWTVENKAGVTLTFHYREAPDEADARDRAEEIARAAQAAGLSPHHGRKVLEVRPPVQADKGTAVRRLLAERGIGRALYAGDDTTDLDAFRGLEEADLDVALKVAVASKEMNPALLTRADLVVDGPGELLSLLRTL
jgi:trehalose 6-phosphate phosphatase